MKLIIVRHGETDHNVSGIVMGHAAIPLNPRGIAQAERVAQRLQSEQIDVIYASDLERARVTAEHIAAHHPEAQLLVTPLVRERSLGVLEGQHRDTIPPARQKSGLPFHEWKPEQGESMKDMQQRAATWFREVQATHGSHCVVLVSHGGFIYSLLTLLYHGDDFDHRPEYRHDNTGVTIINIDAQGQLTRESLNDTSHLNDMGDKAGFGE
jgi:broad specificity phosphatase PhoE